MNPTNVVGRRVAAFIIDSIVYYAIVAVSWLALTKKISGQCLAGGVTINGNCHGFESGSAGRTIWFLIILAAGALIWWLLPAFTGTSPGHAAVGLRIIARDGGRPGIGRGLARALMWIVDGLVFCLVAFVAALTDQSEHRRLGDRVGGTLVIDKRAAGQPLAVGPGQQQPPYAQQQPYGQQQAGAPGGPAPGWYDDPHRQARLRYWDGTSWTEQTTD